MAPSEPEDPCAMRAPERERRLDERKEKLDAREDHTEQPNDENDL